MPTAAKEEFETVVKLLKEAEKAKASPADLLKRVTCVDAKTGEVFEFDMESEPTSDVLELWQQEDWIASDRDWTWQRRVLDDWLENQLWLGLKGRQLGITWLAGGYGLWKALTAAGSTVIVISVNEAEAAKVVGRIWDMYESLPEHLRYGANVLKPSRGARPYTEIQFQIEGKISKILGLPATKKAGHGETAAVVILDEEARQDYADEIWKGVLPTMADGGQIIVISTANGVSGDRGEGNHFHHLYVNSDTYGIKRRFLHWALNPARTKDWYNNLALPPKDKAEQYPNDPDEAFILTGDQYFSAEALKWYFDNATREPKYRCEFVRKDVKLARMVKKPEGVIGVYKEPERDHKYAIGADNATGRGRDFQAAYVLDLATMEFVAEVHCKRDADEYAYQLHFLGRWYNTAVIAPEMGGGYGEPVVINLRDGKDGRPTYPNIYRHRVHDRSDLPIKVEYGFPMTMKTRPQVINAFEAAIREREIPYLPRTLLQECQTFIYAPTNPSPRAQDGCNDDRVMSACLALELYRQFGSHPDKHRRQRRRKTKTPYPWLRG